MGAGRPTSYDPKYCDLLIEHRAKGFSFESFAWLIRVSKKTLYNWKEEFPEFLHAAGVAEEAHRYYQEAVGLAGTRGLPAFTTVNPQGEEVQNIMGQFNASTWQFMMKNTHAAEWKDKHEVESTNKNLNVNADSSLDGDGASRIMAILNSARERRDTQDNGAGAAKP